MNAIRPSFRVATLLATALITGFVLTAPAAAQTPCNASVTGTAAEDGVFDDHIDKNFDVEITVDVPCADVDIDLVTVEIQSSGEELKKTTRSSRQVTTSPITQKATYRIARDSSLSSWEFKVVSCLVCSK